MAEPTLALSYTEILREVGHFAGWSRSSSDWTTDQTSDFTDILKRGLRKFYYPPPLEDGQPRHEWSFLKTTATIPPVDGTGDYTLEDDFSGVIVKDGLTFGEGSECRVLEKIEEAQLRSLRAKASSDGTPVYYALRVGTAPSGTTAGIRWEALLYPTPDSAAAAKGNITYRYVVSPDVIDSSNTYPYGGAIHSETLLEAILAAAEEKLDDDAEGVHYQRFLVNLAASIRADKAINDTP